jgi:hypothetical protein
MKKFELSFVQAALDQLVNSGFTGVLVGGHAVNFWALNYRQPTPAWSELLPYTSEDVDFLGGRAEALHCKKLFGGTSNLNDGTDPSPQAGVILAPINGSVVRFDIITSIIGVETRTAIKTALTRPGEPTTVNALRVLHPLHCLIGKTAALAQLPQSGRQDLKHLKLSVLIVHAFVTERIGKARPFLNMVERIFDLAMNELGLRVWHQHDIEIEKALPLEILPEQKDERLLKFASVRLPQLLAQLASTRQRYRDSLSES